jgi:hypothetical protein
MALSFKKANKVVMQSWRPDFRDFDRLPDVKRIRTDFLLNSVTGVLSLSLLIWLILNITTVSSLRGQVGELDQKIEANSAANRDNIQLNNQFQTHSRYIEQMVRFGTQPIHPIPLLEELAMNRPTEVLLSGLSLNPVVTRVGNQDRVNYSLGLQGTVRDGGSRDSSAIITDFRNALGAFNSLSSYVQDTQLSSFTRNVEQGFFNFNIQVSLDPARK